MRPGNWTWGTMGAKAVVHAEKEPTVGEILAITKRAQNNSSAVSGPRLQIMYSHVFPGCKLFHLSNYTHILIRDVSVHMCCQTLLYIC